MTYPEHQIVWMGDSTIGYGEELIDGTARAYSEHRISKLNFAPDGSLTGSFEKTTRTYAPKDES